MNNPYLSRTVTQAALRALNLRPTRGMGQNFLMSAEALEQIVAAAELTTDDVVIEVGPGLGVLTWELVHRVNRVIAVELDKRLAERLHDEFRAYGQTLAPLHIIQGDVLNLPPATILHQAGAVDAPEPVSLTDTTIPYKVVANLPYAITSPVLRHFLEQAPQPRHMVVLVQWEVGQRIVAKPGKLSMLAHAIQMYAEPEIKGRIAADSFFPVPSVDTAILALHIRSAPAVDCDDINALFRVIKAGFLQPRKKLSNALPGGFAALGIPVERETVVTALNAAYVSPDRRAETLTLDEWARVYQALQG